MERTEPRQSLPVEATEPAPRPRFLRDREAGSLPLLAALAGHLVHAQRLRWLFDGQLLLELFVASNLGVLAADIVLAHSVNQFRNRAEYLPFFYSLAASVLLLGAVVARWRYGRANLWRYLGYLVGWAGILLGLAGVVYHLQSSFFADRTLRSLTYAAPFAAPLAYTGLGFLIVANRMIAPRSAEWARWVIAMAAGGFFGNFVFCLTDHATNGFFMKTEWIPVVSSAMATGFLIVPVLIKVRRGFLDLTVLVLALQALVGVVGFWFHLRMNLAAPGTSLFEKSVYGAPPMAPLLFPNLVVLALFGLWELAPHLDDEPSGLLAAVAGWFAGEAE